jgi:hypothetical protein
MLIVPPTIATSAPEEEAVRAINEFWLHRSDGIHAVVLNPQGLLLFGGLLLRKAGAGWVVRVAALTQIVTWSTAVLLLVDADAETTLQHERIGRDLCDGVFTDAPGADASLMI